MHGCDKVPSDGIRTVGTEGKGRVSMQTLRFFCVLLLVWAGSQIITWGYSELILKGSQLERMLGLEDVGLPLKIFVYTLFPLPFSVVITRRLLGGEPYLVLGTST
ncbi:hypothetical protein CFELI_07600 [Corynebacterium felinum]|uniref:Uncharacterized protein n=1 Tax=Corynebacterium felinum TaxID=131318 RepID=A0ABU2BB07_9CORY|nr:hypothetical protein [Corynebacterium felinum]WJY95134.1 hypothetical protein CFELI_07600 [Corynebacterium felinum]